VERAITRQSGDRMSAAAAGQFPSVALIKSRVLSNQHQPCNSRRRA